MQPTERLVATFIGTDGSLGYQRGQRYELEVDRSLATWPIVIVGGGARCPYSSERAFRRNWRVEDADAD